MPDKVNTDVFCLFENEWQVRIGDEVLSTTWNSKGAALAGLHTECRRRGISLSSLVETPTQKDPMTHDTNPDPLPKNHKAIKSTKTYGHDRGLSVTFRQHRAQSHCRHLHGYAIGIKLVFAAHAMDSNGWVVDFGGLKDLWQLFENTFDHKTLVAQDDPMLSDMMDLHRQDRCHVVVVPATGCEAMARMVYESTQQWMKDAGFWPRAWLVSAEVSEHGANSAICEG